GGLSSYLGPGQAILYTLLDLRRRHITLRTYINMLEETVIILLARYGIAAHCRPDAPGVYVSRAKIASLALCVYKGCCYHGIALNVDMDLTPFDAIVPCGLAGVKMTQVSDYGVQISATEACYLLADILAGRLNSHCSNDTLAS
ncbi:MAG: lipoyl(octanoyl) transferase LipB, partial [Gammaproteobacteria bacterium]|nr:lipoyl(octanoyl) transferase LipB [Gammaproteobacteria bacterium]